MTVTGKYIDELSFALTGAQSRANDLFVVWDNSAQQTKRMNRQELKNALWGGWTLPAGVSGTPGNSQVIAAAYVNDDIEFAADLDGFQGYVGTPPGADVDWTISKVVSGVATTIGTVTISNAGAFTAVTPSNAAQAVAEGSWITIQNQASADATLANVGLYLVASFT